MSQDWCPLMGGAASDRKGLWVYRFYIDVFVCVCVRVRVHVQVCMCTVLQIFCVHPCTSVHKSTHVPICATVYMQCA